jgi:hypothetical protein
MGPKGELMSDFVRFATNKKAEEISPLLTLRHRAVFAVFFPAETAHRYAGGQRQK